MSEAAVFWIDAFGVPQPFSAQESAWLRFLKWLRETGRLADELPETEELSPQAEELTH